MAVSEWDKQYLSEDEQKKIADVTAAAQAGTMTWADAHSQAEAIRNQHQYSGGAKGNQYNDLTGGFGATAAPTTTVRTNTSAPVMTNTPLAAGTTPTATNLNNPYAGTNYHQDAIDAAMRGDWDAVNRALGARDAKTLATGQNYGRTSQDIYNELWAQYGAPSAVETGDVSKYLKDMYANQTAAELAALKATYEKNVADVEANVPKINEMYEAARNETAAQSEIDKRNFAEYAAARSLNTGTSGQAELARQVALTGNLAGITGQEKNALAENELQKQQLTIAYRNAIDEATAQGNAALAQSLYNEYVRQIEMNTQQSQLDREYAYNIAMGSLQAGIVPDASTLAAAGISAADANNLAGYYKVLGTQKSSGSSSGGYTPKSNMTLTTAKAMAAAGQFTDEVLATLRNAGFNDAYLESEYGYDPNPVEAGEISNESLAIYQRSIQAALSAGNEETAQGIVNKIWDKLTESQQAFLTANLA